MISSSSDINVVKVWNSQDILPSFFPDVDRFQCLRMEQQNTRARQLRRTEFQDIWKSSITPEECIKTCSETDYDYAGISLGYIDTLIPSGIVVYKSSIWGYDKWNK